MRKFKLTLYFLISFLYLNPSTFQAQDKQGGNKIGENYLKKWGGEKIPEFQLEDLEGNIITNDDLKNRIIVFNFWFINCKPCIKEMPELNKLVEKYKKEPVIFLAPALDEKSTLIDFLKATAYNYKVLPESTSLVKNLEIRGFPTHLILNHKGEIEEMIVGAAPDIYLKLDSILQSLMIPED